MNTRESKPRNRNGEIVIDREGCYSVIGKSKLLIPNKVGNSLLSLINKQSMLIKDTSESPDLTIWLMLNCRKTANLIRGDASLEDLTDLNSFELKKTSEITSAIDEDIRDRAGIVQMFKDLHRFINLGRRPILFGKHDEDAGYYESESNNKGWLGKLLNGDKFPQTVHIFEFKQNTPIDVRKRFVNTTATMQDFQRLGFTHTLEVLGIGQDGTIHCAHKTGPKLTDKIIIQDDKEFEKWLRFGFDDDDSYDQYELATFVAISGHLNLE